MQFNKKKRREKKARCEKTESALNDEEKSLKEITFPSYRLQKKSSKQEDDAKLNDAIVIVIVVVKLVRSLAYSFVVIDVVPSTPHVFRSFTFFLYLKNFGSRNSVRARVRVLNAEREREKKNAELSMWLK